VLQSGRQHGADRRGRRHGARVHAGRGVSAATARVGVLSARAACSETRACAGRNRCSNAFRPACRARRIASTLGAARATYCCAQSAHTPLLLGYVPVIVLGSQPSSTRSRRCQPAGLRHGAARMRRAAASGWLSRKVNARCCLQRTCAEKSALCGRAREDQRPRTSGSACSTLRAWAHLAARRPPRW
jgi:hypothetical protein